MAHHLIVQDTFTVEPPLTICDGACMCIKLIVEPLYPDSERQVFRSLHSANVGWQEGGGEVLLWRQITESDSIYYPSPETGEMEGKGQCPP